MITTARERRKARVYWRRKAEETLRLWEVALRRLEAVPALSGDPVPRRQLAELPPDVQALAEMGE